MAFRKRLIRKIKKRIKVKMYLMYRYNSFMKDEKTVTLIRVRNKEYRIKKRIFTYEELLDCISYFKEPRNVDFPVKYELNSPIVRLLLQMEVLGYSEIDYPDSKVHHYLIKNYKDFNNIENELSQCDFKIYCFTSNAEVDMIGVKQRIKEYFSFETTNKKNRVIKIVLTDGSVSNETVMSEIVNESGNHYIIIAINGKQECRIFSTDVPELIGKMLNRFMVTSEKSQGFTSRYVALISNYCVLLIMDLLSVNSRMYNTYSINAAYEIRNRPFYGFSLDREGFQTMKTECIVMDPMITPAEAVNRFIIKSKDLLDIEFTYEFTTDDNDNLVKSIAKDGEIIVEVVAKNKILLDAAKHSVAECVRRLFEKHGVNVEVLFGYDAMVKIKESSKQLEVFAVNELWNKIGVLIYRVD